MKTKAEKRNEERKRQEELKAKKKGLRMAKIDVVEMKATGRSRKGRSAIPQSKAKKR